METSEKQQQEEVPARVDLSQYENWMAALAAWKKDEAAVTEALKETLPAREKAAKEMLAFAGAPPSDHRKAQEVLAECSRKRSKLEASLQGAKALIASYEKRIAEVRPEWERQKERRMLAAKLRGEL